MTRPRERVVTVAVVVDEHGEYAAIGASGTDYERSRRTARDCVRGAYVQETMARVRVPLPEPRERTGAVVETRGLRRPSWWQALRYDLAAAADAVRAAIDRIRDWRMTP